MPSLATDDLILNQFYVFILFYISEKERYRQCALEHDVIHDQQRCVNTFVSEMNEVARAPPKTGMKLMCRSVSSIRAIPIQLFLMQ